MDKIIENKMDPLEQNLLQFRLESVRDGQRMSRISFLVSTILSLAIILATWNAYHSWYVDFPLKETFPQNEVTKEVQREVIKQWVESSIISVQFLGIKVGVSDGSVFGSIGLLIISIWFFLSIRRENHVIGFLLCETKGLKAKIRQGIYHGITSHMIFTSIGSKKEPLKHLMGDVDKHHPDSFMRIAFNTLVFIPAISILFLIISDIMTIFILPAYYRFPHTTLFEHLKFGDVIKLSVMEGLAFTLFIFIVYLCFKTLYYMRCTRSILREYVESFKTDLESESC